MNTLRAKPVVFVGGSSRSGKTVLSRILGRSPDLFAFGECHFFERLCPASDQNASLDEEQAARLYARLLLTQRVGILAAEHQAAPIDEALEAVREHGLAGREPAVIYDQFLRSYAAAEKPGALPCEQTGANVFYVKEIMQSFDNVRMINMIRDPRDVLVARKEKWQGLRRGDSGRFYQEMLRQRLQAHPYIVSRLWRATARAAAAAQSSTVRTLRFEDLLAEPQSVVEGLCDFIGITYAADMLELPRDLDTRRVEDNPEVALDSERGCLWDRPGALGSAEVFICQWVAGKEMQEYGYALRRVIPNPLALLWHALVLPVKILVAVITNRKRVGPLANAVGRRR